MTTYTEKNIKQFPFTNLIHSTPQIYHDHTFWEITIILTGQARNVMRDAPKNILSRGDVIVLRPNDCHYIRPLSKSQEYTHRDIYISIEKFKNACNTLDSFLYKELESAKNPPTFHLDEMELLNLNNHFNYFLTSNKKNANMDSFHTALICYLLGLYIKNNSFSNRNMPSWLVTFLSELHKPEVFTQRISEIIKLTHYSHSYICSQFKYYMQKTLNDYLLELRMNYAASLLSSPNISVFEVAMQLGYTAPTNFIAAFKKYFNISPKQWQTNEKRKI